MSIRDKLEALKAQIGAGGSDHDQYNVSLSETVRTFSRYSKENEPEE